MQHHLTPHLTVVTTPVRALRTAPRVFAPDRQAIQKAAEELRTTVQPTRLSVAAYRVLTGPLTHVRGAGCPCGCRPGWIAPARHPDIVNLLVTLL